MLMRWSSLPVVLGMVGLVLSAGCTQHTTLKVNESDAIMTVHDYAGPVNSWPRVIPARVKPAGKDDILFTALGAVESPVANAVFDPAADTLILNDGTVIPDYYKNELGIQFYQPIDKTVFPVPPSGWCSWYYFYTEIDAQEVLTNARWIADNLKPFGAEYVQIDDGWQGVGRGLGDNRDWFELDVRFSEMGMDKLAEAIHKLGLKPGLWLAPHGQSNTERVDQYGCFLKKPDGSSASDTWEGQWLLDPSVPESHEYLRDLFTMLTDWGYDYFKIDGQPIVIDEYGKTAEFYAQKGGADLPEKDPHFHLYRKTLETIRETIGEQRYLLGCWGIPLPGIGIMNGSRTSGDVIQGFPGYLLAARAVQHWNFLHNIAWYCDPDVFMVRQPLPEGIARGWATIQGLTGQSLLTSDRLPDLPAQRVEMLRRIYPAVDIRPLNLYREDGELKPVWDLKVQHLGRSYDVVGVFNFDDKESFTRLVKWADLGLDPAKRYHVYDFWQGTYLGAWSEGVFVDVPPADVRVLTFVPAESTPVLISTNRHITQGWVDLLECETIRNKDGSITIRGKSRIVDGDPYTLVFGLPIETREEITSAAGTQLDRDNTWKLESVTLSRGDVTARTDGIGTVEITVGGNSLKLENRTIDWQCRFVPDRVYHFPVQGTEVYEVKPIGENAAEVTWQVPYLEHAGYTVYVDGQLLGTAFYNRVVLDGLNPGQDYTISYRAAWYDGSQSPVKKEFVYHHPNQGE